MDFCREGDEFVVWKLDRFQVAPGAHRVGRCPEGEGSGVREPAGILGHDNTGREAGVPRLRGVAEFERDLILERTMAGLEAARSRERHGGRLRALDEGKAKLARRLKEEGEHLV